MSKETQGLIEETEELLAAAGRLKALIDPLMEELEKRRFTVGNLLDSLEEIAAKYRREARGSLKRNSRMYGLLEKDLKLGQESLQRLIEAILCDFINAVAREHGGDRGQRPEYFDKKKEKRE